MSVLTLALDRILNWLQQHTFDASLLQPGLSDAEIGEISKDLPIRLPEEVYELYRWRNGTQDGLWEEVKSLDACIFPADVSYGFFSLQMAVQHGASSLWYQPRRFWMFYGCPEEYVGHLHHKLL